MEQQVVYGVTQSCHGHVYKWVFAKDVVENIFKNEHITSPERDTNGNIDEWIDILWPIGGSNSSSTEITPLYNDDEIKSFLLLNVGNDLDDPSLVEISEYMCDVCTDNDGQLTDEYLKKFGLTAEDCHFGDSDEGHLAYSDAMIQGLKEAGYVDFDYDDPFYGENRDMQYSELCELYEMITGRSSDTALAGYIPDTPLSEGSGDNEKM